MRDEGHEWTTQRIVRLEAKVRRVYEDALDSANDKYAEFTAKFRIKDKIHREELKAGKITQADYRDWLKGQVFQRKRLEAQIDDLARTMTNANQLAAQIINDATPEAFAYNANWAAFQIEQAGNADMGFGLYDTATVKRLIRDDPSLLPPSQVDIPVDLRWNTQKITAQINQGIILGEDLATIAKRLRTVTTANANTSLTHARTAMTGAQNAGRIETYHRAEAMGIKLEKEWLATLDSRTRHAHGMLDGQHVPVDGLFKVENYEIRYPGDPTAHPAMVYNCRCTLISRLLDYPAQNAKRRDEDPSRKPIKDMTFAEWLGMKGEEAKPNITAVVLAKSGQSGIIKKGNVEVRKWYLDSVSHIPDSIDPSLPMEERARQAFEARNNIRTEARNMMADEETRKRLDKERPNKTFEELVESKMRRKGMTREQAIRDVYETATKTNENVNRELGLGDE